MYDYQDELRIMGVDCKNHRITTMNADRGGRFLATGSGPEIRAWCRDDKGASLSVSLLG